MSVSDPVGALLERPRFGAGVGLHRVSEALEHLDPAWDAIKITGSNGKGSTATMVAAVLQALGLRVGLYTSPHLRRLHERIAIQGRPVDDAALRRGIEWLLDREAELRERDPTDHMGAFEALTLVAVHCFAEAEVDVVVAEAGIGGRYDPTRVIPGRTCGLVSVELEHTRLLGDTEEAIAFDKADLCPPGGELVVGRLDAGLSRRLRAYCRLRDVTVHCTDLQVHRTIEASAPDHTVLSLRVDDLVIDDLRLAAAGPHQIDNAAVAIRLVQRWIHRHCPDVTPSDLAAAVRTALASLRLRGRLERIHVDPTVVIDVGHTAVAMARVAESLAPRRGEGGLLLVAGVSHDRDPALLAPLLPLATEVVCTRAHHRGGDPARIAALVEATHPRLPRCTRSTLEQAMPLALARAREVGMTVLVAGGLFVAMEAACVLEGGDPRALRFF